MMQVTSATSPTNRSPETTPALRCFSANALPIGRPNTVSNASRRRSARFPPPRSGEITQRGSSPTLALICAIDNGAAVSATAQQRNAFSKATSLYASSVTTASVASKSAATYRGYPPGAGVFQRPDEEQRSTELVIGALVGASVKAMDHVDTSAPATGSIGLALCSPSSKSRSSCALNRARRFHSRRITADGGLQSVGGRRPHLIFHHGAPSN